MGSLSLYDDDIVTWAEQQAAALRRLGAMRADLSNVVDWANVAEEIESLGRSEIDAVESLILNVFVHVLKAHCDAGSLSRRAWAMEVAAWLRTIHRRYRPSMRARIDLDTIWSDAAKLAFEECRLYGVRVPPGLPATCPFDIADVTNDAFTFDVACARLDRPAAP